jgi:hypothetical protein
MPLSCSDDGTDCELLKPKRVICNGARNLNCAKILRQISLSNCRFKVQTSRPLHAGEWSQRDHFHHNEFNQ